MESGNLTSAAYAKIVKQAWSDPQFKAKLVADPAASLAAAGVSVRRLVTVKIVEDNDKVMYFVLPPQPAVNDLDDGASIWWSVAPPMSLSRWRLSPTSVSSCMPTMCDIVRAAEFVRPRVSLCRAARLSISSRTSAAVMVFAFL